MGSWPPRIEIEDGDRDVQEPPAYKTQPTRPSTCPIPFANTVAIELPQQTIDAVVCAWILTHFPKGEFECARVGPHRFEVVRTITGT